MVTEKQLNGINDNKFEAMEDEKKLTSFVNSQKEKAEGNRQLKL